MCLAKKKKKRVVVVLVVVVVGGEGGTVVFRARQELRCSVSPRPGNRSKTGGGGSGGGGIMLRPNGKNGYDLSLT